MRRIILSSFDPSNLQIYILGAGRGSRLKSLSEYQAKPLLRFLDKSLLEWQIDLMDHFQITDRTIITGYKKDSFNDFPVKQIYNSEWESKNMLHSFLLALTDAKNKMRDFLLLYGDILISEVAFAKILNSKKQTSLPINLNWQPLWQARMVNIKNDIESLKFNSNMQLTEIGRSVQSLASVQGQFMGILSIERSEIELWYNYLKTYLDRKENKEKSTTEFIDELIQKEGLNLPVIPIEGGWLEFDTDTDWKTYLHLHSKGLLKEVTGWSP